MPKRRFNWLKRWDIAVWANESSAEHLSNLSMERLEHDFVLGNGDFREAGYEIFDYWVVLYAPWLISGGHPDTFVHFRG